MDFDAFAAAIGAASWMLLDTDGVQYVVFLPVYVYLKQSAGLWRVERQPDDCTVIPITDGHATAEAALETAYETLMPRYNWAHRLCARGPTYA